ncbi:peptide/nickel transport system permease protein [Arthrobacter sp. V4I6]|uniref:ABC transporter permease n=1 Tax=unclassified Arthrobacter TaxID=235627 RepID=UPI002780F85D|nr:MULTISPECIES: ABC transporter permease [unclassified Arthrobacter]MDQ0819585.1 peptide/nickel transport system permease protein [Arthrobacter sp. V1I7]MDQ0853764.1 peptide/nickel transport system permease protein [Arthrobacter sp. V4I6]
MNPSKTALQIPAGPAVRVLRQRAIQAAAVVLLVSTACFAIVQSLPGDIAFRIAAGRYGYDHVTAASADAVRAELGLDRPAWQQLLDWLANLLTLDLGTSLVTGAGIAGELGLYLSSSVQLAAAALALALAAGVTVGVLAAARPGGVLDRMTTLWVSAARALPPFLLGLVLILFFSVHLGVLPAAGHGQASNIVLPAATLAVGLSGLFARVTRDTVVQIRQSEYVRFAATKGLGGRLVFLRHILRNTGVTLIAYIGVQLLILIEGVVVVESLFAWPGLGHALVHAIFWRDIPMIQATALALALLVVVLNTVVDLGSLALDPRPRSREAVL